MIVPMIAAPPTMGSFWETPGDQRSQEEQLDAAVRNLDSDIQASTAVSPDFVSAWNAFKADWDGYYASQGGVGGWFSRFLTADAADRVADYRTQLAAWQNKFSGLGGQVSGPGLVPPPADSTSQTLKYIAITAGVLGGIWVLAQVLPVVLPRRRAA